MLVRTGSDESATGTAKISCVTADNVNVAFYQNAIPIICELAIENTLGRDVTDVSVHLTAEPSFLSPGVWRIERIADHATRGVANCGSALRRLAKRSLNRLPT
jgi:hypothetical protein